MKSFMLSRCRRMLSNRCFKDRRHLSLEVFSHERLEPGAEGSIGSSLRELMSNRTYLGQLPMMLHLTQAAKVSLGVS